MLAEQAIITPSSPILDSNEKLMTTANQFQRSKTLSPYQDLYIVKLINKAKFPVYLACSRVNKEHYAMKIFPWETDKYHRYFKNEIRFACLNHTNIIRIVHVENEKSTICKGIVKKVSYIIMEYAPYGDFYDIVTEHKLKNDNKLIRTYFKQLIEGVEYLHKRGIAHMDLKLENLLLGDDYVLKIADFDLSFVTGDKKTLAKGTKCYRAPEVINSRCANLMAGAADIYSAGIILFIMKSGGILPHSEDNLIKGVNFHELLYENNQKFWEKHSHFQKSTQVEFEPEFRELFNTMTRYKPEDRASLQDIKKSKWYEGDVYSNEELREVMKSMLRY